MRLRFAVPIALLATLAAAVAPGVASAAIPPQQDHGLTIHTFPNPSLAGERFVVQGRLTDPPVGGQKIDLYRQFTGSAAGYTRVRETTTDAQGYYQFDIEKGISTNQNGFVIEHGHPGIHSHTLYQQVQALVSLTAIPANPETLQRVVFAGHVTPNHAGERVYLQEERANGDFVTLRRRGEPVSGLLGPGSNYAIHYRFLYPGARELRAVFAGDLRNIASPSDTVSLTVQQAQNPSFTINSSSPITEFNKPVTINGTLYEPGSKTPEGTTSVTLMGRGLNEHGYRSLGSTVTLSNGSYSFPRQSPTQNEVYKVVTTLPPARHTAQLLEGVRSDVTLMATMSSSAAARSVTTFSGMVTPDKAGKPICLQRLGADGEFHNVICKEVSNSSKYEFVRTVFDTGTFRTRIAADLLNLGNVSNVVTVNGVLPPAGTVPTGS